MEYPDDIFYEFIVEYSKHIQVMDTFLHENKEFFEFMFNSSERETFSTSANNILSFNADIYGDRIKKAQLGMDSNYNALLKQTEKEREDKKEFESSLVYALKEIDELKDEIKLRDSKIEQLEDEVSDLKKDLETYYEE